MIRFFTTHIKQDQPKCGSNPACSTGIWRASVAIHKWELSQVMRLNQVRRQERKGKRCHLVFRHQWWGRQLFQWLRQTSSIIHLCLKFHAMERSTPFARQARRILFSAAPTDFAEFELEPTSFGWQALAAHCLQFLERNGSGLQILDATRSTCVLR